MNKGEPGSPILSVRDLTTTIHSEGLTFDVVRGMSLDLYPNEIVCLVGESGCGKTIAALSVMRLLPEAAQITGGSIRFKDKELVSASEGDVRAIRAEEISMIFQDPLTSLDPSFTVGSILKELIKAHRGSDDETANSLAIATLDEVEIPDAKSRMNAYPHELSGGMRQRVMIAMALVLDPDVLIADEPTTALDVTVQAQILERLVEEQRERQMAMLLITHDLAVVASVAHRVAVMYSGEIVEQAPIDQLFADPQHPYTQGLIRALPHV
ncbi:MAG TPA: ABC transporter ATP-binding protein, partial [Acidimicrobiia bacterium]|nr:ABC transporter ATP-binding protein [Acidimicrobiia bacterium]